MTQPSKHFIEWVEDNIASYNYEPSKGAPLCHDSDLLCAMAVLWYSSDNALDDETQAAADTFLVALEERMADQAVSYAEARWDR